ncbi:MAG: beta-N-acetylglucosaminidase [Bacteroidetes bacterium]|nr:beta-N-acetylglucosaminidase [Bacteroidota bacterium]
MRIILWALWLILCVPALVNAQSKTATAIQTGVSIIPQPEQLTWDSKSGVVLRLTPQSPLHIEDLGAVSDSLSVAWQQIFRGIWKHLKCATKTHLLKPAHPIHLSMNGQLGAEAYHMEAKNGRLSIIAGDPSGMYYAFVSLQLILEQHPDGQLPAFNMIDRPRFSWRGMHLDVCRHFFTVAEIKRYLDLLARYKLNRFHWHLTEDQGWRLDVPTLPKLTSVGAWRKETLVGRPVNPMRFDGIPYGGYYSRLDIQEVVRYAAERNIVVVPEIEMPGHALAALSAYPELSCTGGPFEPATHWGVFDDVFCAGKDTVFRFLETVLTEVVSLFPGTWVHIGGDECPKKRWEACGDCQKRMREEGLADAHELQSYFIRRIERFLGEKGRKLIGWDEILEGGLAPDATVMSWRGNEGGTAAARAGHDAIMSPGRPCYFDHYQSQPDSTEPLAICCYNSLSAVYDYEPIPQELSLTESRHILGAQGNVWTEYMPDFDQVTYMAVPRMPALAEVLWSPPQARNYPGFLQRLKVESRWLDQRGYRYARHFLTGL